MKCMMIISCLLVVGLLVGIGYGSVASRGNTQPRGSLTEERGREIEDRARAGHREVIEELNNRFEGYREHCYPMPKGCRCQEGDKLVRYQHDQQCKGPKPATTGGRGTG